MVARWRLRRSSGISARPGRSRRLPRPVPDLRPGSVRQTPIARRHPRGGFAGSLPEADRSIVGLSAATLTIVLGGSVGYMWIEGWGFVDSFYMTIITLSTVGFGEVRPLGETGRLFTAVLIVLGVATLGYGLRALGDSIVVDASTRLRKRIHRMQGHAIVCGYGRIARPVVEGLRERRHPFAVIEASPERAAALAEAGAPVIVGDATTEDVLLEAGIERAEIVAALLPSDGDNLSVTMTAKALNPRIRVIARSEEERSRANLYRAGARKSDVVSPHSTAGSWVLQKVCAVELSRLVEGLGAMTEQGFGVGRLLVERKSPYAGRTLREAHINRDRNLLVLAIHRNDGGVSFAPDGSRRVEPGETLVLLGQLADVEATGAVLDAHAVGRPEGAPAGPTPEPASGFEPPTC